MQQGTTNGLSEPKKAMSKTASMKSNGTINTNILEREPISGAPLSFLLKKSKKSHPPKTNIVKSLSPKANQEKGAPACKTPYSHMAPGTEGIKEMSVIMNKGIAKIRAPKVIHPTVETR